MADKGRLDHLKEATTEELMKELEKRRQGALQFCSEEEIAAELSKRPKYDGPKHVEK
jgi:hypothetical protein